VEIRACLDEGLFMRNFFRPKAVLAVKIPATAHIATIYSSPTAATE